MSALDLSATAARTALAGLVDDTSDDDDIVTAYARAIWSVLTEPGDGVAGALVTALGPIRALEIALATTGGGDEADAAGLAPRDLSDGRARWQPRACGAAVPLDLARRAGVDLLTPEHAAWPTRADDLGPYAPLCLWVRGDVGALANDSALGLVGARASSAYGEHITTEFAADAVEYGITVVSGAAYGIDGAAHQGALAAAGRTVALLAGGVESPYPAGHRDLIGRIASTGAAVSEVPCGTTPTKWRFLARNRLIAVLSDATVVVEAGWRSGAINTAHHAQSIGRPVGAVPGPITSASSMGCHRLLREGVAQCVTTSAEVRELLGLEEQPTLFDAGPYTDDRTRVMDALSTRAARDTDDIARRGGFGADEAAGILGLLELEGTVRRQPGGWVRA